jgi:hypothetical protein
VGSCGLCSIQTRHLFTRVQRKNKGLVCVEKWGESLGGHVVVRNSEENVEMSCVYCVVSVLHASLLPLFRHVFDPGFRRRRHEKQGLVRVENVANVALGYLACLSSSLYGVSVLVCLSLYVFVTVCSISAM